MKTKSFAFTAPARSAIPQVSTLSARESFARHAAASRSLLSVGSLPDASNQRYWQDIVAGLRNGSATLRAEA